MNKDLPDYGHIKASEFFPKIVNVAIEDFSS
jgi:hypothetical protein